ncbi:hypothetical protein ALP12_00449 [Pseudomonas savastanoi pv. phaseolicola]|uniref:hypothetical protein n=1 Tax=Pseudomonas savastanoi TaxID=29438 RepID=UPI000EFF0A73|nr:hypothetical protein [Pseudomonas savastanoi]RMV28115.1 hypothetical protein ALP12_00449 [Pseudomonas savastanoi pv. phaseolicola]
MSKFKASTRLTEINAEQVEQLRREYNEISVSKFSLSDAFKQHLFHNRSYVVIAKNANHEEFSKYNQILANLHTNLSQIKNAEPEITRRINNSLRNLIKMKLDVSRLRFKTLEIKTSTKPDFEPTIHLPLFDDSHSERRKQYTISLTEQENKKYQETFASQTFVKLLFGFFDEFTVYEKEFSNTAIFYTSDETLLKCSDAVNNYVVKKTSDEKLLMQILIFLESKFFSEGHQRIIKASADLLAFIDGAK